MTARQIALCGLLSALAVVAMVLTGAMGIGTFIGPVVAMVILLPLREEYGSKPAAGAYGVTALLGLLLVPDRELALVYAAFGWYPLLHPRILRIRSRLLRVLTRVGVCTSVTLLLYGGVLRILGLAADLLDDAPLLNLMLLGLGNVTFLLLDRALTQFSLLWRRKFRRRFFPTH